MENKITILKDHERVFQDPGYYGEEIMNLYENIEQVRRNERQRLVKEFKEAVDEFVNRRID